MEYYVVRVKYLNDGTIKKSELMSYSSLSEAQYKLHKNFTMDFEDTSLKGSMCCIVDNNGFEYDHYVYGNTTKN